MTCSMLALRSPLALGFCPRAIEAVVKTRTPIKIVRFMESSPLLTPLAVIVTPRTSEVLIS